MQTEQSRALEAALWSALRSLEERGDLFRRMARRSMGKSPDTAARFERKAEDVAAHADAIRRTIAELGRAPAVGEQSEPAA
jgi:two-component system chemotaxis response regulator CheB